MIEEMNDYEQARVKTERALKERPKSTYGKAIGTKKKE